MELIQFKNIMVTPSFLDFYPEIDNFNVKDQDVFICSYPKCGTTWTQEMAWLIGNNLDYNGAEEDINVRSPYLELSAMFNLRDNYLSLEELKTLPIPIGYLENTISFINNLKSPRFIKTHLPWNLLPKQIRDFQKKPKIIWVSRNSKDACNSHYHYAKVNVNYNKTFDEFCQTFLDGNYIYGSYWDHYLNFQKYSDQPNVLSIKYEDMKQNLPGIIREVANFLDKNLTNEEIEILEKHLNFESMKNNKSVNNKEIMDLCKKKFGINDDNLEFIRIGKVNDYQNYMSPEFVKKFDNMDKNKLNF